MKWRPIDETEILERLVQAESRMSVEQYQLWQTIKITPVKWRQTPWGDAGGGFWAVALIDSQVVWFNDIEAGFNSSIYKTYGCIDEYWCNQDELEWVLQSLLEGGIGFKSASPTHL